jgi:hypothetical protein
MAEARDRAEWRRTQWMLALTANVNRDPKRTPRAFQPSDFGPYATTGRIRAATPPERWWDLVVAEGKRRHPGPAA